MASRAIIFPLPLILKCQKLTQLLTFHEVQHILFFFWNQLIEQTIWINFIISKINIITPINEIINPIEDITFHAV